MCIYFGSFGFLSDIYSAKKGNMDIFYLVNHCHII